jgi:hypothetical protein
MKTAQRLSHLLRGAIALVALVLGVGACGPDYDRTDISGTVPDELGGGISIQQLDVHEGMILKSHIVSWNDDNEQMPLVIRSLDPSIIEVAGVINDHDFAFVGRKAGHTQVQVVADDVVVLTIEANVIAQPAL